MAIGWYGGHVLVSNADNFSYTVTTYSTTSADTTDNDNWFSNQFKPWKFSYEMFDTYDRELKEQRIKLGLEVPDDM